VYLSQSSALRYILLGYKRNLPLLGLSLLGLSFGDVFNEVIIVASFSARADRCYIITLGKPAK
jgi:hypothetical protein